MTMLTPPSPPAEPLLGHLRLISKDAPAFLRMLGREYGDISTFRLGRRVVYFVNNPDYIQQVVQSKQFSRTNLTRKLLSSFLGDGLFSQEGALHLQQRRLMQPAFHRERYPLYANVMVDNSLAAVSDWRDGETRSITQAMMHLTLEIVSQALFGSSTSTEARQIGEALALVQKAIDNEYELYSSCAQANTGRQWRSSKQPLRKLSANAVKQGKRQAICSRCCWWRKMKMGAV